MIQQPGHTPSRVRARVRVSPPARMRTGLLLALACAAGEVDTLPGALLPGLVAALWLLALRTRGRLILTTLALAGMVFLPFFLLAPCLVPTPTMRVQDWLPGLAIPWRMLARGTTTMLVTVSTLASLSPAERYDALASAALPPILRDLLIQTLAQVSALAAETRRLGQAISLRSSGRTTRHLLRALPRVWMTRLLARGLSQATAMELRGFTPPYPVFRTRQPEPLDLPVLGLAVLVLALTLVLRTGATI